MIAVSRKNQIGAKLVGSLFGILFFFGSHFAFASVSLDSADSGFFSNTSGLTSYSFSHTVGSGVDTDLAVCFYMDNSGGQTVSSVTYDSEPMTLILHQSSANLFDEYVYNLVDPPIGTNNVDISLSGSISFTHQIGGSGVSYFGVDQSSPIDSYSGNAPSGSESSFTLTTSVVNANSWLFSCANNDEGEINGVSTGTSRSSNGNNTTADSNTGVSSGAQSIVFSKSGSSPYDTGVIVSLAPASGGPPPTVAGYVDDNLGIFIGTKLFVFLLSVFVPLIGFWWVKRGIFDS